MIYMHWVPTGQTVNKEYYAEVLKRKRFLGKRPALFKSGPWHFHQDNAPVHNPILVIDYLTKMGINTVPQPPYSRDLAPCDFWLFPKLRGCRHETIYFIILHWALLDFETYLMILVYIYIYIYIYIYKGRWWDKCYSCPARPITQSMLFKMD